MNQESNVVQASLISALTQSWENVTFEEIEIPAPDSSLPAIGPNTLWAAVPLLSPYKGELSLELPGELARAISGEVFDMVEAGPSLASMQDLMGELLNTVAGRFLDALLPPNTVFQLGLPETGQGRRTFSAPPVTSLLADVAGQGVRITLTGDAFGKLPQLNMGSVA